MHDNMTALDEHFISLNANKHMHIDMDISPAKCCKGAQRR